MSIDKIGSINTTLHADLRAMSNRQHPVQEKTENITAGKAGGVSATKTNDPPFFPLCVTQSMFKAER